MKKPDYHVVCFSGGKDSTAMLLRMLELGMPVDEILFCDTTVEFPQMYEHLKQVEKYIGRPITAISADKSFEHYLLKHEKTTRDGQIVKGYSWAGSRSRWCTYILKQGIIKKHLSELREKYNVVEYIGIAADEPKRIKDKFYPLVEWGWTEKDCLEHCYSKGFTWGGLYKYFRRVSCWCCPLQPLEELRVLRKTFPDLWRTLKEWDSQTWRKFRADYSVNELEIRFALEDEWKAQGKDINPRKKEFREALKKALGKGSV